MFILALNFQYLRSLQARKGPIGGGSKKKGAKAPLIDLDADDEDDGDDGDTSFQEREAVALKQLENALGDCATCGKDKFCKTAANGTHISLSFHARRAWASALVRNARLMTDLL